MPQSVRATEDPSAAVHHGLRQRAETAGEQFVARVPRARLEEPVAAVLEKVLGQPHDSVDIVCVLDERERLCGVVPLARLLAVPRHTLMAALIDSDFPRVHPGTDQERVASLALHHALAAIPVIDANERLLGVVPSEALLRILRREHVEDLHLLAGITRETQRAREAMEAPPLRRLRHRLPWLLLGLLGSTVATFIVARFESALALHPAIVFFVPGLVYLADAIGTQTEAVAVRGMSLSHARLSSLVAGELRTGLLIGLVLGGLTLPAVWWVFGNFELALAVAASLLAAGAIATTIGLLLPWLLGRLGSDPAYGSGPLATIVQDLLSLLTYFLIISLVVL
ncbi:MAG: magnesium transporter [Burkholderiaceae bacterium]|nr:magnesium transporter [Burkholderiaceae bacterium]